MVNPVDDFNRQQLINEVGTGRGIDAIQGSKPFTKGFNSAGLPKNEEAKEAVERVASLKHMLDTSNKFAQALRATHAHLEEMSESTKDLGTINVLVTSMVERYNQAVVTATQEMRQYGAVTKETRASLTQMGKEVSTLSAEFRQNSAALKSLPKQWQSGIDAMNRDAISTGQRMSSGTASALTKLAPGASKLLGSEAVGGMANSMLGKAVPAEFVGGLSGVLTKAGPWMMAMELIGRGTWAATELLGRNMADMALRMRATMGGGPISPSNNQYGTVPLSQMNFASRGLEAAYNKEVANAFSQFPMEMSEAGMQYLTPMMERMRLEVGNQVGLSMSNATEGLRYISGGNANGLDDTSSLSSWLAAIPGGTPTDIMDRIRSGNMDIGSAMYGPTAANTLRGSFGGQFGDKGDEMYKIWVSTQAAVAAFGDRLGRLSASMATSIPIAEDQRKYIASANSESERYTRTQEVGMRRLDSFNRILNYTTGLSTELGVGQQEVQTAFSSLANATSRLGVDFVGTTKTIQSMMAAGDSWANASRLVAEQQQGLYGSPISKLMALGAITGVGGGSPAEIINNVMKRYAGHPDTMQGDMKTFGQRFGGGQMAALMMSMMGLFPGTNGTGGGFIDQQRLMGIKTGIGRVDAGLGRSDAGTFETTGKQMVDASAVFAASAKSLGERLKDVGMLKAEFGAVKTITAFADTINVVGNGVGSYAGAVSDPLNLRKLPETRDMSPQDRILGGWNLTPRDGYAVGGPFSSGQEMTVGEYGPERVRFSSGGYVVPNINTRGYDGSGGGGSVSVQVNISTLDPGAVANIAHRKVFDAMTQQQAEWRKAAL